MTEPQRNPLVVVVGAGPGLGASIGHVFGAAGYDVALLARSRERLDTLGAELQAAGVTTGWAAVDLADAAALSAAVQRFAAVSAGVDVLHYNPSVFREKDPLELTPEELLADVRVGVAGLLTAVQAARPALRPGARVTATGSMAADRPWHRAASLGVQKAALRNLVTSLDATLRVDGVRAVSLTVNGTLSPDTRFAPDLVAAALLDAVRRPDVDWTSEVGYG